MRNELELQYCLAIPHQLFFVFPIKTNSVLLLFLIFNHANSMSIKAIHDFMKLFVYFLSSRRESSWQYF
ncbi:hypothetical protein ACE6H2_006098 [Prunus campanulata]